MGCRIASQSSEGYPYVLYGAQSSKDRQLRMEDYEQPQILWRQAETRGWTETYVFLLTGTLMIRYLEEIRALSHGAEHEHTQPGSQRK